MTRGRRVVVIGGGILGLAVAERVLRDDPSAWVTVVEKEHDWARHQTGRNSGVVHSGLYYPPGSRKALWCRAGAAALLDLARAEGVPHRVTGKLVVATTAAELDRLGALEQRGLANGLAVTRLLPQQAREHEPHVAAVAALHVAETGIIDYRAVCAVLVRRLRDAGARLLPGTEVVGGADGPREVALETTRGDLVAEVVVSCAGLHADRVARLLGHSPSVRIVPFRGEYHELTPAAAHLVRGLVYPVPDPELPFLGVHLTRGIDGQVHAGPNAVLALAREGYDWAGSTPATSPTRCGSAASGGWRDARPAAAPARCCAPCRTGASPTARDAWCLSSRTPTSCRRPPGCGPRPYAPTARSSTTSCSNGTAASCTCSTRPHRPPRHPWRSRATWWPGSDRVAGAVAVGGWQ
ncbi:MAG: L-2-hydroxyglutarate oxidase [Ornithinibacter sp.]